MDRKSTAIAVVVVVGVGAALAVGLAPDRERGTTASTASPSSPSATPDTGAESTPHETTQPSPSGPGPLPDELPGDAQTPPSGQPSTPLTVTVTRAGQDGSAVQVSAFVAGVSEEGGTCSLELEGPSTARASSAAFADATTTICSPLTVETGSLSPGAYTATVSYTSGPSKGTSQPVDLEVTR